MAVRESTRLVREFRDNVRSTQVEDAFRAVKEGDKHAMKTLEARLTRQLNELVAMVRQDLNKINRKKVNTLLIVDVHSRDIVWTPSSENQF